MIRKDGSTALVALILVLVRPRGSSSQPQEVITQMLLKFQQEMSEFRSEIQVKMLDLSKQMNAQIQDNLKFLKDRQVDYQDSINDLYSEDIAS